ncbi:M20 metallopeptidase family protein [Streptomyces sp. WZ-12]|uniref:M20 metallopeptidase family protein n=1 Tax=Streptomyces sp. WZ-12 TaxID=3030210 RepID=UPI002381084E|nr:amidohydrolase [Streptomyces sp. WZ-12]
MAASGVGIWCGRPAFADALGRPVARPEVATGVARLERELVALRRDIHRHPEAPGKERRTAGLVAQRLRHAGLSVTTGVGGNGVVGVLRGCLPGRTVAYRADMDAVPPEGIIGGGTATAHVCGHDIHTTVAVGVAQVLAGMRQRLSGTVVFLFQPAEESLAGARRMLDSGVLERTGVQEIHALHCGPFPVGQFAVTPGFGLPGLDHAEVDLHGPDAPVAARQLAAGIGALATVTQPKTAAELARLVADLQRPDSPLARFVFARAGAQGSAVRASVRCWPPERYREVREEIRQVAGRYSGAEVAFPAEPFPAMVCPAADARALARHLRRTLGRDAVTVMQAAIPFSGEDFALYLQRVPGTYTFLGVRRPGASVDTAYPHFPDFAPDERAIGLGVRAMAGWLTERTRRP